MAQFTVEVTYLVPVYRHVTVEAETEAEACHAAIGDPTTDYEVTDYESARPLHVTGLWSGDTAYQGEAFKIPDEFAFEKEAADG